MTTPRLPPEKLKLPRWTPERDAQLCELIAEGDSFAEAGEQLGITKSAALGRFQRIAARMEGRVQG